MPIQQAVKPAVNGCRRPRGDLLAGLFLPGCDQFEEWRLVQQDRAIELAERALHEFRVFSFSQFGQAGALTDLGFYLESAGEWSAAAAYLAEARALYTHLGTIPNCVEPQAVEARCMVALGRHAEAQSLASEVWKYLVEHGYTGIFFPALVYVGILDVVSAIEIPGVTPREVLEAGYRDLTQRAGKISDTEWCRSYLENAAENRAIVERWQAILKSDVTD